MSLRCDDVRNLMEPSGAALPFSTEQAEQIAEHLDQCADCEERLGRRLGETLGRVPVPAGPSLPAVRELIRKDQRRSTGLRLGALAAAALALAGTGWALLRQAPAPSGVTADRRPVEAPIPDPPKIADLKETERRIIRSEGVVALYLQFCLTCLNNPTEQDKQEYLTRSLLIFREVRGRIRSDLERETGAPTAEAATLSALNDALTLLASSKLPSVTLAPTKALAFHFLSADEWQVDHVLAKRNWRLSLPTLPDYLNFAYLKTALGANDSLMGKIEEALWMGDYVELPKRLEDKDPTIAPKALQAVLPLLSPRQQAIYRKLVGSP